MKRLLLLLVAAIGARADILVSDGSFGLNGDLGFETSPAPYSVVFGSSSHGSFAQVDSFLYIPGQDFGFEAGPAADLQYGAPKGITLNFGWSQPTAAQLLLTYTFTNTTQVPLAGLQFLTYLDADIGDDYTNNRASVHGATGGTGPSSYQIGDPALSSVFTHVFNGGLDGSNDYATTPGDVSLGLGFEWALLAPGDSIQFQLLFSDDSTHLGNFFVRQTSPQFETDQLTISGAVATPEPASWALTAASFALLLWMRRATASAA